MLDEATGKLSDMTTYLGDKADEVTRLGVSIGKDGMMTFLPSSKRFQKNRESVLKKQKKRKETIGLYRRKKQKR